MKDKTLYGMVAGYYLSRFDTRAYERLELGSIGNTHIALGEKLGVAANSIKNYRDEFDPIHKNSRQGWHGRPMRASCVKVARALDSLSEEAVYDMLAEMIASGADSSSEIADLSAALASDTPISATTWTPQRGLTGLAAESAFAEFHASTGLPRPGKLVDCRHLQCGYDYRIECTNNTPDTFIEVKGLAEKIGGITLTPKEWRIARELREDYFLAIVHTANSTPDVTIIPDPASRLSPLKTIYTTVQVSWSVTPKDLEIAMQNLGS